MAKVCLRSLKTLKKTKNNCTCTLATLAVTYPTKKYLKLINKFPSHVQLSDYLHVLLATLTTRPVINITHFFSL